MLAGGEGVGSELRPFIATPPAVMLAKERFVPAVTEAMVTSSKCRVVILMQRRHGVATVSLCSPGTFWRHVTWRGDKSFSLSASSPAFCASTTVSPMVSLVSSATEAWSTWLLHQRQVLQPTRLCEVPSCCSRHVLAERTI
jgi:hypothetical protein